MSKFKKSKAAKAASVFVSLMTGLTMLGGVGILPVAAVTIEELQAQINSLLAQLAALKGSAAPAAVSYTFTKTLKLGSTGPDVLNLQKVLNSNAATKVAESGAGSPGNETSYFGGATRRAVIKYQELYADELLAPLGLASGTGVVGPATRTKLNSAAVAPTVPIGTTVPPVAPAGTGLAVKAGEQPAPTLAPNGAARVPFTTVVLTAGNDGDVTVTGLTVERTGLAADAAFAEVVLLDENDNQIGVAKTLNSDHRAVVGDTLKVPAGKSRMLKLAGNMAADNSTRAGQVAFLTLVGVNTSATVSGSLPITGAGHTINASLAIGSVTMQRGTVDPGASQTKEVGTTGYTFSSVKVTAGSAEKVYLKSIRWNQTGSVSGKDFDVKTYVEGTAYDAVASSDGKYYTSIFGDNAGKGILIDKGFSKEISIKGDIKDGSGRTVDFDIAKRRDINLVGELYGYGITPPQTGATVPTADTSAFSSSEDPWYDASQVTISAGTMTVSSDSSVSSQNIAVNLQDQPLGGFSVDVRGEQVTVSSMVFNVTAIGGQVANITNMTLVDGKGAVLAGPVDGSGAAVSGTVTFTSSVTFPIGITKMTLRGKLSTAFITNNTVAASTTPSTQWTNVRGLTTGNTITAAPATAVTGSTMTVKAGSLAITVSTQPVAQTVIAGANQFEFARYILDAGQSGEDVRVTTLPVLVARTGATAANHLTSCQLYDGSASVTTGSNLINVSVVGDQTFTFDKSGLIISKGMAKTISLKCNLSTAASSGTVNWGLTDNSATYTGASGITSGQTITETMTASAGQTMTAAVSGSYTVAVDTSSAYNYRAVRAGTSAVLAGLKFTAGITEDVTLRQIALVLGNTASNSPADLVGQKVTIWDGATRVGEAQFGVGANPDNATSTLSTPVTIVKGETKSLQVRADLINHDANTNAASTPGSGGYGAFLAVNYDGNNNGLNGNYATGASSGVTINGTSASVSTNGVRVFRNVPQFEMISNGGTLAAGADLLKFKVVNPDATRDLVLKKVSFTVATTGSAVTAFRLKGDGVAAAAAGVNAPLGSLDITFDAASNAKVVPAGTSKTYVLSADTLTVIQGSPATDYLSLTLLSDQAYPSLANLMGNAAAVEAAVTTANNVIWSPFSTTTPEATAASESNLDWTNGFGIPFKDKDGTLLPPGQDFSVQTWSRTR